MPLSEVSQEEKERLLDENKPSEGIGLGDVFIAYSVFFALILLMLPKIYLANNIYYLSRDIQYLKSQRESLKDENANLQQQLESTKFGFLTLDIEEIK